MCLSKFEIEALIVAHALEFGVRNWSCHVVLEGDSELVMTALVEEGVSLDLADLLIKDAVHLSTSFSKLLYSLYKERRE